MSETNFKIPNFAPTIKRAGKTTYTIESLLQLPKGARGELVGFWKQDQLASGKSKIGIEQMYFVQFLEFFGFRKVVESQDVTYVRVNQNVLYQVTIPEIKDFVVNFLEKVKGEIDPEMIEVTDDFNLDDLSKFIYLNTASIFNKEKLEMIKTFEGEMYQASKFTNAFFFKDAWVKITPEGMTMHEYLELPLNMSIWANSVIDFEIKPHGQDTDCDFKEFIRVITGKQVGHDHVATTQQGRMEMLEQAIGYLMHPFFEGALRAILFTDVNSSNQKANGRTGKGLISQAISKIFPTSIIPAKRWKNDDKGNFSQCTKDTKLIVLDDIASNFQSEWIFNNITEGTVVKHLYKSEFTIMTKVMLNTNQMIRGDGSSTRGRFLEFEIENFFNDKYKPIDYFGKNFFSKHDWDLKEYAAFYWYLMSCSYQNLQKVKQGYDCGVVYIQSESIEKKRLIRNLEEDFVVFMDGKCLEWFKRKEAFEIKILKMEYLEDQNDKFRKLSSQKFKDWILEYCNHHKFQMVEVSRASNRIKYEILSQRTLL